MKIAILTLAVLLTTLACRSTSKSDSEATGEPLEFKTLLRGYHSGLTAPGVHVARNAQEWEELWRAHSTTVLPRPDAPAIDWSHQMVVCVTLGNRPSGGYAVEVQRTLQSAEKLRVEARETKPEGKLVPMVVTQPYHMITVAPYAGEVELAVK